MMRPVLLSLSLVGVLSACSEPLPADSSVDQPVVVDFGPADLGTLGCTQVSWMRDADGDGYGDDELVVLSCAAPEGYVGLGGDCDDAHPQVHPRAQEQCDERDNDCNGRVDDGVGQIWYADVDADGFGDATRAVRECVAPQGMVSNGEDCDDRASSVFPGASEWCDGVDNDCDFVVDEAAVDEVVWHEDLDGDGFGSDLVTTSACFQPAGYVLAAGDCDDLTAVVSPVAVEVCDGLDNNCDGAWDEAGALGSVAWHPDRDGDGFGDPAEVLEACTAEAGWVPDGSDCDDGFADINPATLWFRDNDLDGHGDARSPFASCLQPAGHVALSDDCDDTQAAIHPGADERCDGLDQDCDGIADEGAVDRRLWYADSDSDGFGDGDRATEACFAPEGYVDQANDCVDSDAMTYPGAVELCDGFDNDCDGSVDNGDLGAERVWYRDVDGDGFGRQDDTFTACEAPAGYVSAGTDCDDDDPSSYPDARWYPDLDGDGYGGIAGAVKACFRPVGYLNAGLDCDDGAPLVHPAADELCDGIDNNCDFLVDDSSAVDAKPLHYDWDGDGFGGADVVTTGCREIAPYVFDATDCDDTQPTYHPGARELCDGMDRNCDGLVDQSDAWWDARWPHRILVEARAPGITLTTPPVAVEMDFGSALIDAGIPMESFDPQSVRVVAQDCTQPDRERPSQFEDGVVGFRQRSDGADLLDDGYGTLFFHLGLPDQPVAPMTTTVYGVYFGTYDDLLPAPEYPQDLTATSTLLENASVLVAFDEGRGGLLDGLFLKGVDGLSPSLMSQAAAPHGNGVYTPSGALLAQAAPGTVEVLVSGPVVAGVRATGFRANNDGAISYTYDYWLFAERPELWTKSSLYVEQPLSVYHIGDWAGGVRPWQTRHNELKYTDTVYDAGTSTAFVGWGGWGVRWGFVDAPLFHYATSAANGNVWEQSNDFQPPGSGVQVDVAAGRYLTDHAMGLVVPVAGDLLDATAIYQGLAEGVDVTPLDPESW